MKLRTLLTVLVCICCTTLAFSQTQKKTTKKIDVNVDVDVTAVYEQVVKEGYGTAMIYKELANAHYFKSNYSAAKKWFEMLFEMERPTDATLKYRYKQTLKALQVYNKENEYLSYSGGTNE